MIQRAWDNRLLSLVIMCQIRLVQSQIKSCQDSNQMMEALPKSKMFSKETLNRRSIRATTTIKCLTPKIIQFQISVISNLDLLKTLKVSVHLIPLFNKISKSFLKTHGLSKVPIVKAMLDIKLSQRKRRGEVTLCYMIKQIKIELITNLRVYTISLYSL